MAARRSSGSMPGQITRLIASSIRNGQFDVNSVVWRYPRTNSTITTASATCESKVSPLSSKNAWTVTSSDGNKRPSDGAEKVPVRAASPGPGHDATNRPSPRARPSQPRAFAQNTYSAQNHRNSNMDRKPQQREGDQMGWRHFYTRYRFITDRVGQLDWQLAGQSYKFWCLPIGPLNCQ